MKTKTLIWSLIPFILAAFLGIGIIACDKDKDDDDDSTSIVGSWEGQNGRRSITLTFNKTSTGTWQERYYDSYSGTETEFGTFTYSYDGNNGILYLKDQYNDSSNSLPGGYDGGSYSGSYGYDISKLFFKTNKNIMSIYEDANYKYLAYTLSKQ